MGVRAISLEFVAVRVVANQAGGRSADPDGGRGVGGVDEERVNGVVGQGVERVGGVVAEVGEDACGRVEAVEAAADGANPDKTASVLGDSSNLVVRDSSKRKEMEGRAS